jgi:ABC-type multidrug transport system fused ATPase/permease subunit
MIDGVNVSEVGLDLLRSGISIIPQDPVLFSGTIRHNIDPFNTKTDDELWDAVTKSNLATTVRALPGGLQFVVSEGGENLSSGQRQLLCLTRWKLDMTIRYH